MATFHASILIVDKRAIGLKFIESMIFRTDSDPVDRCADILRDDRHIDIITVSGREYTVSVKNQLYEWQLATSNLDDWQEAVYNAWKNQLEPKK